MAPTPKFKVEEDTFIIQKYHEQQALDIPLSDILVKRAFRRRIKGFNYDFLYFFGHSLDKHCPSDNTELLTVFGY